MYNYNNPYQPQSNNYQNVQQQMQSLQQEYQQRLEHLKQQVQQPQPYTPNPNQMPENQPQMPNMTQQQPAAPATPPHVQQLAVLGDIKGSLDKLLEINTKLFDSLNSGSSNAEAPAKEENKVEETKDVKPIKK